MINSQEVSLEVFIAIFLLDIFNWIFPVPHFPNWTNHPLLLHVLFWSTHLLKPQTWDSSCKVTPLPSSGHPCFVLEGVHSFLSYTSSMLLSVWLLWNTNTLRYFSLNFICQLLPNHGAQCKAYPCVKDKTRTPQHGWARPSILLLPGLPDFFLNPNQQYWVIYSFQSRSGFLRPLYLC